MSSKVSPDTPEPLELDPDFIAEEHAEFARLEREHPYIEEPEEKARGPKHSGNASDGKHDVLFLILFIFLAAVFLRVILFGGGLR